MTQGMQAMALRDPDHPATAPFSFRESELMITIRDYEARRDHCDGMMPSGFDGIRRMNLLKMRRRDPNLGP